MPLTTLPDNLKPAVEKAAKAYDEWGWAFAQEDDVEGIDSDGNSFCYTGKAKRRQRATAAILAFLNAAIEAGEAREAKAYCNHPDGGWLYSAFNEGSDFFVLILRMGDTND